MSSSTPLASPDAAPAPSAAARALAFYWGNYLPLMMVFVVFFGYLIPAPGESHHGRLADFGTFERFFSRFLAVKHRIGAYDGLLCPHVVPSVR